MMNEKTKVFPLEKKIFCNNERDFVGCFAI